MNYFQNLVFAGLGTISVTVPTAGSYFLNAQITLPSLNNGAGVSGVVAVIKVNASTVFTGNAGATGAQQKFSCAAGDTVSLILTSSSAVDQGLNVVKSTIAIGQGE